MKQMPDFKIGDTVYDNMTFPGEEGRISAISEDNYFPVNVIFNRGTVATYSLDGAFQMGNTPTLSHTPYDLVNGGFSQRMKLDLPEIEVDRIVYVRTRGMWQMRHFSHFNKEGDMYCFVDQKMSTETTLTEVWEEWSLTNPLEK